VSPSQKTRGQNVIIPQPGVKKGVFNRKEVLNYKEPFPPKPQERGVGPRNSIQRGPQVGRGKGKKVIIDVSGKI